MAAMQKQVWVGREGAWQLSNTSYFGALKGHANQRTTRENEGMRLATSCGEHTHKHGAIVSLCQQQG